MTTKGITVHLQENEKELFKEWLQGREEALRNELKKIRDLQAKLEDKEEEDRLSPEAAPVVPPVVSAPVKLEKAPAKSKVPQATNGLSWTGKIIQVFQLLNRSLVSKEIIDWFFQNDPTVQDKSRAFVSKSVTSKLAVLEEKGVVKKKYIDKKYVYTFNGETASTPGEQSLFGNPEKE